MAFLSMVDPSLSLSLVLSSLSLSSSLFFLLLSDCCNWCCLNLAYAAEYAKLGNSDASVG